MHCVGVISKITDKTDRKSNYYGNCESLVRPARLMGSYSTSPKKKVVMVSSMTAPFFMNDYLQTKREAENYLIANPDKFTSTILRPGLVWHLQERKWIIVFGYALNPLYYKLYSSLVSKKSVEQLNWLYSVALLPLPTHLDSMVHFTLQALQEGEHSPRIIDAFDMAEHYWRK